MYLDHACLYVWEKDALGNVGYAYEETYFDSFLGEHLLV